MILTLPLVALQLSPLAAEPVCGFDRPALLALGVDAFDQDLKNGWREVAKKKGCQDEAADLIWQYRKKLQGNISVLYWHEGQLRASAGQTRQAIILFKNSKSPGNLAWNAYVDATIAFLVHDAPGLRKARDRLLAVPRPKEENWRNVDGTPRPAPKWPMNIEIVDSLVACFGKSYTEAYRTPECRRRGADATTRRR
jgi:hypothetical protein